MKKFILTIMLMLTIGVSISAIQLNAQDSIFSEYKIPIGYDFFEGESANRWTQNINETGTNDHLYFSFDYEIDTEYINTLDIVIPELVSGEYTHEPPYDATGYSSRIVLKRATSDIVIELEDELIDQGVNTAFLAGDETAFEIDISQYSDYTDIEIYINCNQLIPLGSTWWDTWQYNQEVNALMEALQINYYDKLQFYGFGFIYPDGGIVFPDDPTPPDPEYQLAGWAITDGRIINDLAQITVDDLQTITMLSIVPTPPTEVYVLHLYSRFISADGDEYVQPSGPSNAPEDVDTIFSAIGLGNNFGKYIVFLAIIILMSLFLALIHAPALIYLITYTAITTLWVFLGFMPMFASILIYLLCFLIFIYQTKRGESYE